MKTLKHKSLLPVYLVGLAAGKYTLAQAAGACGYSVVRMCQLKQAYLREGLSCLDNKNLGHVPSNKTPEPVKRRIVALYASPAYAGINFKYFGECLEHYEGVSVSYTTLRAIMSEYGIKGCTRCACSKYCAVSPNGGSVSKRSTLPSSMELRKSL